MDELGLFDEPGMKTLNCLMNQEHIEKEREIMKWHEDLGFHMGVGLNFFF